LAPGSDVQVGDILLFGTSHPCLTFDKWKTLLLVDDDYNVLDVYTPNHIRFAFPFFLKYPFHHAIH
ncbi:hypothetical protein ACG0R2_27735, partial [Klebsiella pneumoniae]